MTFFFYIDSAFDIAEPGILMTKFYLKFNTMKLIVNAPGSCSVEDVLRIISHSEELSCM